MKKDVLLTSDAQDFLLSLELGVQQRFTRCVDTLAEEGFLIAPYAEKIEGQRNLFSIRITQGQNVRFFYCYDTGVHIYVLNGYEKKRQKIPHSELDKAIAIKKRLGL